MKLNEKLTQIKFKPLLNESLQTPNSYKEFAYGNLSDNYADFDFLLIRIAPNDSGNTEGTSYIIIPNFSDNRIYFSISENYNASLQIRLTNNNQIGITARASNGWPANNFYLNQVYGVKLG